MAEMAELFELFKESNEQEIDNELPGEGDMEVGRGIRGRVPEEGSMEDEAEAGLFAAGGAEGGLFAEAGADLEDDEFDDWDDGFELPEEEGWSGAMRMVSAAMEEANKAFLRTGGADDVVDRRFQARCPKNPFDQLPFVEELFSLMVVSQLTEELGCDEVVDQE